MRLSLVSVNLQVIDLQSRQVEICRKMIDFFCDELQWTPETDGSIRDLEHLVSSRMGKEIRKSRRKREWKAARAEWGGQRLLSTGDEKCREEKYNGDQCWEETED